MNQLYVKDLSKRTGVSTQTLHHYDRIGLLNPSLRGANGYRLYSEQDLHQLQQIIALKFFGFELAQIKQILSNNLEFADYLTRQMTVLERQSKSLFKTSRLLKNITSQVRGDNITPWHVIMAKFIEFYNVTQQLDLSNEMQLFIVEHGNYVVEAHTNCASAKRFEVAPLYKTDLLSIIKLNLSTDPEGDTGHEVAKAWLQMLSGNPPELAYDICEANLVKNHASIDLQVIEWLAIAIDRYYQTRIDAVISIAQTASSAEIFDAWHELLNELCFECPEFKKSLIDAVIADDGSPLFAKKW